MYRILNNDKMFIPYAEKAEIRIPKNIDDFDKKLFPHWEVLVSSNTNRNIVPQQISKNAKIISTISNDEIRKVTISDLEKLGCIFFQL